MKEKPWVAAYWRYYRSERKRGVPPSHARHAAGQLASIWWHWMKRFKERGVLKKFKDRFERKEMVYR